MAVIKKLRIRFAVVLLMMGTACGSVRVTESQRTQLRTEPTHEVTLHYFVFGIFGSSYEYAAPEVCLNRGLNQFEVITTAGQVLGTIFTLGIYSPRTLRVWCSL